MRRRRRWDAIILGTAAVLALGTALPVSAQTASEVTESLCKLFTRKHVRDAFGERRVGFNDENPGACYWGADPGDYGGELQLQVTWDPVAFDDLALVTPAASELMVGDRRARFSVREGQVNAVGEGLVTRDIHSDLLIDLDPGPLALRLTDAKGRDRQETLVGLGELAVARAARLVAPTPRDETIAALVPPTIGGHPTLISRVLFPGQELCARCDSGKALRAALETQGRTLGEVSMLTAKGVDPALAGQDDFRLPEVRALRVPSADATALVEPVITYLTEGIGVEPQRVEGDGIIAITRPADEYNFAWTALVYPEADTVWVVTALEPIRSELLAALPGARTPPAIPTPAPTPTPDLSTPEGWFKATLPSTVGGEPLQIQVMEGAQTFSPDGLKRVRAIVKEQGKSLDDVSAAVAFTASGAALTGIRIAGGDAAPLVDVFLDQLRAMGVLGRREQPASAEIGGKSVQVVTSPQGTGYLYVGPEVLWMLQMPEAAAAALLEALP